MPTRTIFFHITAFQQIGFYLLALTSLLLCFSGFQRRWRLWRQGRPVPAMREWPGRLRALAVQVLAHRRIRRRNYAGKMHLLIFYGFLVLFLGTCIVAVEHYGAFFFGHAWFYKGAFYLACKALLDLFGLGLLLATLMALARRYGPRPRSLGHAPLDGALLLLLLGALLTGFLLEGAGIAADPHRLPYAAFSPVGGLLALPLRGLRPAGYVALWWLHVPFVLGVLAAIPYGRWLHLLVAPLSIAFQPDRLSGALEPIRLAQVEETGRIGLGVTGDFDRWQLLSLDACMECGRCTDVCPAHAVGKELNPKGVVLDLRRMMEGARGRGGDEGVASRKPQVASEDTQNPALSHDSRLTTHDSTDAVSDASLWACTNCNACMRECPVLIRHVDLIDGIRRYRVAEGRLSGTTATTLRQLASRENPWGLPNAQRMDWAKGLDVPLAAPGEAYEALLWVGCAGAFDPRGQRATRALARLLRHAGVAFAVLGPRERCTGDPARRIGDEFLFQQLAEANIATLNGVRAQRIVASCPHCFHTLKNEYPAFGGRYEVLHHTQYLAQLVAEGRLPAASGVEEAVTWHDPCFLARVNDETEAPRELLRDVSLREPARREERTFCCGAGGGRMWMEEPPQQRPGMNRAQELFDTGAKVVAVGCPFCNIMLGDSLIQLAGERTPRVMDIAEVMAEGMPER